MKPNKQFRDKFVRKFGKNYGKVVRELRKDAEWRITFYGSAKFLRVAENIKSAVAAMDVLDRLGEPYEREFQPGTCEDIDEETRRWARTRNFVAEWYGEDDESLDRGQRELRREIAREEREERRAHSLKDAALRFGGKR